MQHTTIFSGSPHEINFRNYVEPTTIWITSGERIRSSEAVIDSVSFSFQCKIWAGVSDNFYIHDMSWSNKPSNNGSYWTDSSSAPRLTHATNIAVDSDTRSTWYFTGKEDGENFSDYSPYYDTDYLTISLCRTKYKTSGSTGYVYFDGPYTCTVTWHDKDEAPIPPTNIRFDDNNVAPGGVATLRWNHATMPQGAANEVYGYFVCGYDNDNWANSEYLGEYSPLDYWTAPNNGVITTNYLSFNAPDTTGTYYYRIDTFTNDSDGERGWYTNSYDYIPLTVSVSRIGSPSNLKVNNTTTLYVGTNSIPNLNLTWTAASGGTNNPVAQYAISKNNTVLATVNGSTTSYSVSKTSPSGTYTVTAQPTVSGYGSTAMVPTVQIIQITTAPSTSITSTIPSTTNQNINLTWSAATLQSGATTQYLIYKDNTLLDTVTATNYTFNISTVTPGTSFVLKVKPRYMTANGSYTDGTTRSTSTITRGAAFNVDDSFWTGCYDAGNGYTSGIHGYAHSNIKLSWNAISVSSDGSQGSTFTYALEQQVNGGSFSQIATFSGAGTHTVLLNSISEGTVLGYRMKITNDLGSTSYSSQLNVTKVISPSIINIGVSNVTYEQMQASFTWAHNLSVSAEDLMYTMAVEYDGQSYSYSFTDEECTLPAQSLSQTEQGLFSLSLTNIAFTNALNKLYNKVIGQRYVYPKGTLRVRVYYKHFQTAYAERTADINFNYVTAPSYNENTIINFREDKTYYNPGDSALISLSGFSWADAAGGMEGGIVSNYLSSSYSSNKFIFDIYGDTQVTAPSAASDLSITLTLKTTITYADAVKEYTSNKTLLFKVARWVEEPVSIDSLVLSSNGNYLEGYIQLPEGLCSSSTYNNLVSVTPQLTSPSTESGWTATFYQGDNTTVDDSFTKAELPSNRKIRFTLAHSSKAYSDVTAAFKVIFANSSSMSLTVNTNSYRHFVAAVDMAVRKGRVGINVGNEFVSGTGDSTLQVNAGTQTGLNPIVEILSTSTGTTAHPVNFLRFKDGRLDSKVKSDGTHILIDNLSIPGLTVNRVLASDDNGILATSAITTTQLGYLSGVTSSIQDQLNSKEPAINLTPNKAVIINGSGKLEATAVTSEQIGFLSQVESDIQEQLDNKPNNNQVWLTTTTQTKNYVLAAPSSANGTASFRALVAADIPNISAAKITSGMLSTSYGGTGSSTIGAASGNALNKLGMVYKSSTPAASDFGLTSLAAGLIWLKPKS